MADEPVSKSVLVRASVERAFQVFVEEFDSWWPRSHHIGGSPMKKTMIEGHVGGRCYSQQEDGTDCAWGSVLVWEPPYRLVIAWQVKPNWQYEPDLNKASEVELRFVPEADGMTRVGLEHRHLERHGEGWQKMRDMIGGPGGWGTLLHLYVDKAER